MKILAIDTASDRGSLSVAEDREILGEIRLSSSVQHSERLFRSIEFLFDYLPLGLADIDLFVAARGPGSFTGLRVGLAAVEGFAAAHGRTAAGVSNLEALAWRIGSHHEPIAPVIDARRGEVFGALYRRESNQLIELRSPEVAEPERWFDSLPERVLFCGDGARHYRHRIVRPGWLFQDTDLYLSGAIAEIAALGNCGVLEPMYVRRTDAEIARELRATEKQRHESLAGPDKKS